MRSDGPGGGTDNSNGDSVASATRALLEATAALSRMVRRQVSGVSEEVGVAIAAGLRDAARELNYASEEIDDSRGPQLAKGTQGRRERVDRTRADLLDAAARVFSAQGFEGASVGDVAAAAGYTKGAVYSHFGSKSNLFLTLAREQVLSPRSYGAATSSGSVHPPSDSRDDLFAVISDELAASADNPTMLLDLEVLAYAVRHPGERPEIADLFAMVVDRLAARVRDDRLYRESQASTRLDDEGNQSASLSLSPEDDFDTALGVLAVANITAVLSAISGSPHLSADAGLRVIARILRR